MKHSKISQPVFPPPPETLPPQDTPLEALPLSELEVLAEPPVTLMSNAQEMPQYSETVLTHVLESSHVLTPLSPHT